MATTHDYPELLDQESLQETRPPAVGRRRGAIALAVVAVVYLALSVREFWGAWSHDPSSWLQFAGANDPGQAVFFVAQTPAALLHGLNPLINTWTNWPYGANYMTNTAFPLLALVMAPFTLLTNPILSLNTLFTLTLFLNCLVAYLVVQSFVRNRLAAFFAGLLFGFSPMVIAGAQGHEQVMFQALLPVMFLLLWRLCTGVGRPLRSGLLLGGACAAQLYIFSEPLAECALIGGIGLVVAAVWHHRRLGEHVFQVLKGLGVAAATFVLLGGYGLYALLFGPQHVRGPVHPGIAIGLSSDLLSPIYPTSNQQYTLSLGTIGNNLIGTPLGRGWYPDLAESGAYVGIPLLVLLVVGAFLLRRKPLMRWAAGLALLSFVLSLGSRLKVDGHVTTFKLPFDLVSGLPMMENIVPARFAVVGWFFLALMLGMELAELYRFIARRSWWTVRPSSHTFAPSLAVIAVAVAALAALTPASPFEEGKVPSPSLAESHAMRSLPTGDVVLGYPFPSSNPYLMIFQAEDGMRFRLVGGSLIQPGYNGRNQNSSAPPSACQSILVNYFAVGRPTPDLSPQSMASCASEMLTWKVQTVVWTNLGALPASADAFFTALLGPPSMSASDSALWLNPRPALEAVVADGGQAAASRAQASGLNEPR